MEYTYNILFVDKNGYILDILYTSKRLPFNSEVLRAKSSKNCKCCNHPIQGSKFVLAGNYKIGDKI